MAKKSDPTKKPAKVTAKEADLVPKGYEKSLGELKERIRSAQLKAAVSVDRELCPCLRGPTINGTETSR